MDTYPKIQTVYKRNPDTKFKTLLEGDFSTDAFEYLAHNAWEWTEKVDGTNIRISSEDGDLVIAGRTDNAQIPAFLFHAIQKAIDPAIIPEGSTLYGEGYGAKIQKGGGNYRPDASFVLFDVFCGGLWLKRDDVDDIADKLGIECVPVVGRGTLPEMVECARGGMVSQWGDFSAEGIVARPVVDMKDRRGERIITKIKTRDFRGLL